MTLADEYLHNYGNLYLRIISSLLKLYKSDMDLGKEYTQMNQKSLNQLQEKKLNTTQTPQNNS